MTWTKERLQSEYNLADEDVIKTLKVCNLALEQDEYSDEEIRHSFQVVRSYFDSNRTDTYTGAADLFRQEQGKEQGITQPSPEPQSQSKAKKSGRGRKLANSPESNSSPGMLEDKHLDISELLSLASEKCGTRIKLSEATSILASCGLPDQEKYTQAECDLFLEACDQFKKGKTHDEVATHFGATNEQSDIQADVQEVLGMIGSAAVATEKDLLHVLNKLSVKRGRVISEMYDRLLLTQVAQQLKERQKARAFLADFGERLEAYVEGKSPVHTMRMLNPTSSDQSILKTLPESLDNS